MWRGQQPSLWRVKPGGVCRVEIRLGLRQFLGLWELRFLGEIKHFGIHSIFSFQYFNVFRSNVVKRKSNFFTFSPNLFKHQRITKLPTFTHSIMKVLLIQLHFPIKLNLIIPFFFQLGTFIPKLYNE